MPAPSLSLQHAPRPPGRRSKAAREGNRGRVGTPMSGRYGNFVGAGEAAEVLETGIGGNGGEEPVRQEEVMRAGLVELAGRLGGRWRSKGRRARGGCAPAEGSGREKGVIEAMGRAS